MCRPPLRCFWRATPAQRMALKSSRVTKAEIHGYFLEFHRSSILRAAGLCGSRRGALFLFLPRHFHDLAPTLGLGVEHGAKFAGIAGDGNAAEFAESSLDGGIGKGFIDFPVQAIDDF